MTMKVLDALCISRWNL